MSSAEAARPGIAAVGEGAGGGAKAAASPAARRAAQLEAGSIAELKRRMASRDLSLIRRAEIGDAAIEVWLYQPHRQYYVSVSMQGALRRTLKPVNEAEAWLNFDSFRRLAALGEVGRPVLLGQMNAGGAAPVAAPPVPRTRAVIPGQDLTTVAVTPEQPGAEQDVDALDLALVQQARDNYARGDVAPPGVQVLSPVTRVAPPAATFAPSVPAPAHDENRVAGQSVETLRRRLIGEELVRLVWNADSGQYAASLTRQGRVVGMLRSASRDEALRSYDDLVLQAEARAAAMPEAHSRHSSN